MCELFPYKASYTYFGTYKMLFKMANIRRNGTSTAAGMRREFRTQNSEGVRGEFTSPKRHHLQERRSQQYNSEFCILDSVFSLLDG